MAEIDSLGEAEKEAAQQLWPKLASHSSVSERAFNTVGLVLAAASELSISQVPLCRRVATVLLVRLSNDLRAVALLALRGYALQSATLAGSMYEVAFTVAYIGSDNSKATAWVEHSDPTQPFRKVRSLTEDVARALGVRDPDKAAEFQYRIYRQLCLAKHANPLIQKDHGHYFNDEFVVAMNGPDGGDEALRVARFSLEHATRFAMLAIASFIENHVPSDRRAPLVDRLGAIRREVRELAQTSTKEYGAEDPFPGEW